MQRDHAGRQLASGQPRRWDCMSASAADDGSAAAGPRERCSHAAEVGLQVHQQDCGKNNGSTVDVICSVDQSANQYWIQIERGSNEGTQTQHSHATHAPLR